MTSLVITWIQSCDVVLDSTGDIVTLSVPRISYVGIKYPPTQDFLPSTPHLLTPK